MATGEATFGAGWFWCVQATFRKIAGVVEAAVGYLGGTLKNPTYDDVCTGRTGHAEVVQVVFDPEKVRYGDLLDVFWKCHDQTQSNRQSPDFGTQYRSAVFLHAPEQEDAARKSKDGLDQSGKLVAPIVTEIVPASTFYRAEEYYQRYLEKRGLTLCSNKPQ